MKFMSSFQCLMGGNGVQFQDSSSVSPTTRSSLVLANNDDRTNTSNHVTKKKKKKKKKDRKVIKVFKPDGEINLYHKPIRVSEVMTEEYMVCRSDSFYIGQKIPPLSQHDRLQPGHTYFLLPTHLFHSVLSFVTIASFAATSSKQQDNNDNDNNANMKMKAAFLKKAAASSCPPFDIHKTPSGTLRIRVSELFISQLMMEQAAAAAGGDRHGTEVMDLEAAADLLCTTPQLHREYKQLVVGSRRGWKPKLEMIKETSPPKGKRKVKMLLSASLNRMKRKINNNKIIVPQVSSSSSASASHLSQSQLRQLKKKKKKTRKSIKPAVYPPPVLLQTSSASIKANKSAMAK